MCIRNTLLGHTGPRHTLPSLNSPSDSTPGILIPITPSSCISKAQHPFLPLARPTTGRITEVTGVELHPLTPPLVVGVLEGSETGVIVLAVVFVSVVGVVDVVVDVDASWSCSCGRSILIE